MVSGEFDMKHEYSIVQFDVFEGAKVSLIKNAGKGKPTTVRRTSSHYIINNIIWGIKFSFLNTYCNLKVFCQLKHPNR